jgi:hypothetical protein
MPKNEQDRPSAIVELTEAALRVAGLERHSQQTEFFPGEKFSLDGPKGVYTFTDAEIQIPPGQTIEIIDGHKIDRHIDFTKHPNLRLYIVPLGDISKQVSTSKDRKAPRITDADAHKIYKDLDDQQAWDYKKHPKPINCDSHNKQIILKWVEEGLDENGQVKVVRAVDLFRMNLYAERNAQRAQGLVITTERIFTPEELEGMPLHYLIQFSRLRFSHDRTVAIGENTALFPEDMVLPDGIRLDLSLEVDRSQTERTVLIVERNNNPERHAVNIAGVVTQSLTAKEKNSTTTLFDPDATELKIPIEDGNEYAIIDNRGREVMGFTVNADGSLDKITGSEEGSITLVAGGVGRLKYSFESQLIEALIQQQKEHTLAAILPRSEMSEEERKAAIKALQLRYSELETKRDELLTQINTGFFFNRLDQQVPFSKEAIERMKYDINGINSEMADALEQIQSGVIRKPKKAEQPDDAPKGGEKAPEKKEDTELAKIRAGLEEYARKEKMAIPTDRIRHGDPALRRNGQHKIKT